jgi:hypothetical protein
MVTELPLPQQLNQRDRERLQAYRENLDFYNGIQWTDRNLRRERRLTFNYARVFIDKLTSYLMSGLSFAIDPIEDSPQEKERAHRAEQVLLQVYADNNLELLDFDTEIDCAILGDAAYKVIWDSQEKRVRITSPDVQGIFAWWLGDDVSRVYRVASRYSLEAEEARRLYKITPTKKQVTIVEDWTLEQFTLWVDDKQQGRWRNPYGFIPFVLYPNLRQPKSFWGVSDIPQIKESQRELNRAMSQLSRILEVSGNPIAVLENVEASEDIAVQPGAVWNIPQDARAYLLDLLQGGGIRLHINYIDLLYRTLHDISESPRAAFGGIERDLSGVALEIELHPLLQKVRRKRLIRTAAYKQRNQMVLRLISQHTGEDFSGLRHRIVWGPVLPQDKMRLVQSEQLLVQTGIHSIRRAMDEMGVQDPEQELNLWLEERRRIKQELGSPTATDTNPRKEE